MQQPGAFLLGIRARFSSSLRLRVLVLTIAAFVAVAVPAAMSFGFIVNATILKLGTLFAEKQILYDKHRGLEALMREVALAETLARSPAIIEWAADEGEPLKKARALSELEHFRQTFRDNSYFFVVDQSGNYYFNDRAGTYTGDQLRYAISAQNPRDAWYFKTAGFGPGCHLNVDRDDTLGVTKVWINCVVHDGGRTLGIMGTGIDLTSFIAQVVNSDQKGVESIFVDRHGSVQAIRDASRIDYQSLAKEMSNKKTVFGMLDDDRGRFRLKAMMDGLVTSEDSVAADFVRLGGRDILVGVGYLERLGWFNVTLMDVDEIIDRRMFLPIALLVLAVMLTVATALTFLFRRSVLDRLDRLGTSVTELEAGRFAPVQPDPSPDEIGRLSRSFAHMADRVASNTARLEEAVRDRTERLEQLAFSDPMTGIHNRRGFADAFEEKWSLRPEVATMLVMDIDNFKHINDRRGHQAGDEVIMEFARRISAVTGRDALVGRWGGDEFLIADFGTEGDSGLPRRLLEAIRTSPVSLSDGSRIRVTASIGGHAMAKDETLDSAAAKADTALYAAKRAGRNRFALFDPALHDAGPDVHRVA